MKRLLVDPDA